MLTSQIATEDSLTGQVIICEFLRRALYEYPEPEWLKGLVGARLFAVIPFEDGNSLIESGFRRLDGWACTQGKSLQQLSAEVATDHVRLFIGPKKPLAPPWESVYRSREGLLFHEQTLQVRHWYHRFGVRLQHLHNEPDDHIGLEFGFLAQLTRLATQSLEAGDQSRFARVTAAQYEFANQHLNAWVRDWACDVHQHATTDFYKGVADVAVGTIEYFMQACQPLAESTTNQGDIHVRGNQ